MAWRPCGVWQIMLWWRWDCRTSSHSPNLVSQHLFILEQNIHTSNPPALTKSNWSMMDDDNEQTRLLSPPRPQSPPKDNSLRRLSSNYLPPFHEEFPAAAADDDDDAIPAVAIWAVVPILLLGVFVANADGSLVIATSQHIASEFQALTTSSWLVTSYVLAQCASQPLYGKLSNIFGRRSNLVTAYALFTTGCFVCGIATEYWQVLAGRAISGIGGAGMTALVSIIITDMVSMRNVAAWRSYVNVAATVGRSLGGPIGGWLADTIGWRWSFFGQCPFTILGLLLILWKLPKRAIKIDAEEDEVSFSSKLQRIDFLGAFFLASAISAFLLALDFVTKEGPWWHTLIPAVVFLFFALLFWIVERFYAKEPILPIELITRRDTATAYVINGFQIAAQFGAFYSVPIYFQIAAHTSVTQAGLRLVPPVIGNAIGGLLSGFIISSTGRYKYLTTFASATATIGYLLIFIRWRGETNWAEVMYLVLGGFGMGIIQSTTFIHLAASLNESEIAIAGTALYLAQNLFLLVGIQIATALLHYRLNATLSSGLEGVEHKSKIIEQALSSVDNIWALPEKIRQIVVSCYVQSLTFTYGQSVVFAFIGLLIGLTIKEKAL